MKNKSVAATLALTLGAFGLHRFYLDRKFQGVLYLLLFFVTFSLTLEEKAPFVIIPFLLGFIDSVLFFVMPVAEFDEKYNKRYLKPQSRPTSGAQWSERTDHKKLGVERFRSYDYKGAAEAFERALDDNERDASLHFNLACCYSILEDEKAALQSLDRAIELGFNKLEKIHTHDALAFLRAQPEFDRFVNNDYRYEAPPAEKIDEAEAEQEELPEPDHASLDLLDQIVQLGELRDRGVLTAEEFQEQKEKLLNSRQP